MAIAMTRPVIWPSRVPIRVAAVPVLVGGVPLTGKTLCSICQVQSSPGSSADQLMLKVDELVVEDVWARAASMNRRTRARARVRDRRRMIMGSLGAGGWPRLAHDGANETHAKTKKAGGAKRLRLREQGLWRTTARNVGSAKDRARPRRG